MSSIFSRTGVFLTLFPLMYSSPTFAVTASFTWEQSRAYMGGIYNSRAHKYHDGWVNSSEYGGFFDGCDSLLSEPSKPAYQWKIEQRQIVGHGGLYRWSPYWTSAWTNACKVVALGRGVDTLFNGKTFEEADDFEGISLLDEEKDIIDGTNILELINPHVMLAKATIDDVGSIGSAGEHSGGVEPGTEAEKAPEPLLVGPSFPKGEFRVTFRVKNNVELDGVDENTKVISTGHINVVVLGDSNASGEGNPTSYGQVAPLEIDLGEYYGGAVGYITGAPILGTLTKFLMEDSKVQVGGSDLRCKFTKGAAFLMVEREDTYDPVAVFGDKKRYGLKMQNAPGWQDLAANRSIRSGHVRAVESVSFELAEQLGWATRLFTFASSGATIRNVSSVAQNYFQRHGYMAPDDRGCTFGCSQIDEVVHTLGNKRVEAVIISAGINDLEFTEMLVQASTDIISDKDVTITYKSPTTALETSIFHASDQDAMDEKLASLRPAYEYLDQRIRQNINTDTIILTGYPTDGFSAKDGNTGKSCGIFKVPNFVSDIYGISPDETRVLANWGDQLRLVQMEMAEKLGWIYIDVKKEFEGHGYCTDVIAKPETNCSVPGTTFYRSAERSCEIQGNLSGTLHPNYCGHSVYVEKLVPHLREAMIPKGDDGSLRPPDDHNL